MLRETVRGVYHRVEGWTHGINGLGENAVATGQGLGQKRSLPLQGGASWVLTPSCLTVDFSIRLCRRVICPPTGSSSSFNLRQLIPDLLHEFLQGLAPDLPSAV